MDMVEKDPPVPIIDVTNLNEKVYDFIKQSIIDCRYSPGYKLNINHLSQLLGVSHTPIKDALFRLAGEGLVEIASRMGSYVKNITDTDIHEIRQTRLIMETAVIEGIAERITDEQLKGIEAIYNRGIAIKRNQNDAGRFKSFMECDSRFHLSFFQIFGNSHLLNLYKNLNVHMQIVRFRRGNQTGGMLPTTDVEHKQILDALRQRDPVKAKQAIRNHILSKYVLSLEAACAPSGETEAHRDPGIGKSATIHLQNKV